MMNAHETTDHFELMAIQAIKDGKTMGQFLRGLDNVQAASKDELERYSKAYHKVRMHGISCKDCGKTLDHENASYCYECGKKRFMPKVTKRA